MEPEEVLTIRLENGEPVDVSWYRDFGPGIDHIQFRGPVSETGYLSHLVHKDIGSTLDRDVLVDHLRAVAQAHWRENRERYGRQEAMF